MKKGIVGLMSAVGGAAVGVTLIGKKLQDQVKEKENLANKHLALFRMMDQWVKVKQTGKNLAAYFEENDYQEIAIYGMHYAGETLVEELYGSDVKVKYGIDQNTDKIYAVYDFDIVTPDSDLEEVDAIVVTAITFFPEIEERLRHKVECPIISLDDILYQV